MVVVGNSARGTGETTAGGRATRSRGFAARETAPAINCQDQRFPQDSFDVMRRQRQWESHAFADEAQSACKILELAGWEVANAALSARDGRRHRFLDGTAVAGEGFLGQVLSLRLRTTPRGFLTLLMTYAHSGVLKAPNVPT